MILATGIRRRTGSTTKQGLGRSRYGPAAIVIHELVEWNGTAAHKLLRLRRDDYPGNERWRLSGAFQDRL
jgi:hypothetical protein